MKKESKLPRVAIVDDHPAVLRQVLETLEDDFEVVEVLENGRGLLEIATEQKIDAIVLDITLPGTTGIRLAKSLANAGCAAKIVFLTVHADLDYAREAFHVGAMGYVVKPRLASDLVPALKLALEGKHFISPCPEFDEAAQAMWAVR